MNNYNMKFKYSETLYDISDYMESVKDVPYMKRNPDYTIVVDGYDFVIPGTYTNVNLITEDIPVYIYSGSVLIHNGKVEDKTYDWDKRTYQIKVKHALRDLDDVRNDKDLLNDYVSAFTESIDVYGHTNKLIKHNNLITAYFSASDYQLDWTEHYAEHSRNIASTKEYNTNANPGKYLPLTTNDIYYLPEAMYCINQPKVWSPKWLKYNNGNPSDTSPNTAGREQMVSTLEVVNVLSSMYGYNFIPKDTGSFYVVSTHNPASITISSDEIHSYEEKKYKGATGASVSFGSLTLWTGRNVSEFTQTITRWFPSSSAMLYYVSEESGFNGLDTDTSGQSVVFNNSYSSGSKAKSLKWYAHLVPLHVTESVPYLIYPNVIDDLTIMKLQKDGVLKSGTEITLETFSKNIWSQPYLYPFEEIVFKDLQHDKIELIYRVHS